MSIAQQMLAFLAARGEVGAKSREIAEHVKIDNGHVSSWLSHYVRKGYVRRASEVADDGRRRARFWRTEKQLAGPVRPNGRECSAIIDGVQCTNQPRPRGRKTCCCEHARIARLAGSMAGALEYSRRCSQRPSKAKGKRRKRRLDPLEERARLPEMTKEEHAWYDKMRRSGICRRDALAAILPERLAT